MGTLIANKSEEQQDWAIHGLPPDTPLRLRLYTASPHARSLPVVILTRTLPQSTGWPEG